MIYPRSSYLRKNKRNSYQKRKEKSEINSSFKLGYRNFNYVDTGADAVEPDWINPDPNYTWRGITGTDALCNKALHILYNNVNGIAGNHPDLPPTLSYWAEFAGAGEEERAASLAAEGFVSTATDPYISPIDTRTPTDADPAVFSYLLNSTNKCGTTLEGQYSVIMQKKFTDWAMPLDEGDSACLSAKLSCYGGRVLDETPDDQIDTWERGAGYDPSKCEQLDQMCDNDSNGNPVLNSDYRTFESVPGLKSATHDEINSWTWEGETGGKAMCTLLDSACAELSPSQLEGALPPPGSQREKIKVLRDACNDWSTGNCNKTSSGIISYTGLGDVARLNAALQKNPATPVSVSDSESEPDSDSDELNTSDSMEDPCRASEAKLEKVNEFYKKIMLYGGVGALVIILILLLLINIK